MSRKMGFSWPSEMFIFSGHFWCEIVSDLVNLASLVIDNFLVDQLTTVVSIIPIWISPEFLYIFNENFLLSFWMAWGRTREYTSFKGLSKNYVS
jgi:hypothetical protein